MSTFQGVTVTPRGDTVIRYTNPKRVRSNFGGPELYGCCVCGSKFDTDTEARSCAEADHERKAGR